VLYNQLVGARQRVAEAWSAIDVQLQRRAALIPNLVETVKGYASFERETMTRVAEARRAASAARGARAAGVADAGLTSALHALVALAEAYPDLKANTRFADLQTELANTENTIARARNYYNGAVETYNIRIERFPAVLLAGPLGFRRAEFFSADSEAGR
jgi:LemA protein